MCWLFFFFFFVLFFLVCAWVSQMKWIKSNWLWGRALHAGFTGRPFSCCNVSRAYPWPFPPQRRFRHMPWHLSSYLATLGSAQELAIIGSIVHLIIHRGSWTPLHNFLIININNNSVGGSAPPTCTTSSTTSTLDHDLDLFIDGAVGSVNESRVMVEANNALILLILNQIFECSARCSMERRCDQKLNRCKASSHTEISDLGFFKRILEWRSIYQVHHTAVTNIKATGWECSLKFIVLQSKPSPLKNWWLSRIPQQFDTYISK